MYLKMMFGLALIFVSFSSAQAQVTIEVSKITCDQFVHGKVGPSRSVGLWLSGFYNGRKDNTSFDLKAFEAKLSELEHFCYDQKNWNVPVIQAIEQKFGEVK
jgi:acid stress chaperone HdeB